jgi:hypothetical protein
MYAWQAELTQVQVLQNENQVKILQQYQYSIFPKAKKYCKQNDFHLAGSKPNQHQSYELQATTTIFSK